MKLTKPKLKRIIKEELNATLKEWFGYDYESPEEDSEERSEMSEAEKLWNTVDRNVLISGQTPYAFVKEKWDILEKEGFDLSKPSNWPKNRRTIKRAMQIFTAGYNYKIETDRELEELSTSALIAIAWAKLTPRQKESHRKQRYEKYAVFDFPRNPEDEYHSIY